MKHNELITELIRSANLIETIGVSERRQLLERAVAEIYELRVKVGIPRSVKGNDAVTDLKILATKIDAIPLPAEEVRRGMLQAAGMIRDLYIVRDNGLEFYFGNRT
ncbi:hypothetical protein D3C71_1261380 [compost metagenome]